jgi:hypothetical protein
VAAAGRALAQLQAADQPKKPSNETKSLIQYNFDFDHISET